MKITVERFAALRRGLLGLTAFSCLLYALLALLTGRPDPMLWFIPVGLGSLSAVILFGIGLTIGRRIVGAAMDELYQLVTSKAQGQAYWVTMAMIPLVVIGVRAGLVDWPTGFAAFSCLAGGAYLTLFVWYDWRMG